MPELDDLLERLERFTRDDARGDLAAAIERAASALAGGFEDLAVVRDRRIQLVLLRRPGGARMLVAETANASDRARLLERMRRDDRVMAIAAEILGTALVIPGEPRMLVQRTRRIVELGQQLAAAL